jgi:hypothetical protein
MNKAAAKRLFSPDDIAAAGAAAVQHWRLSDLQCDRLAALISLGTAQSATASATSTTSARAA